MLPDAKSERKKSFSSISPIFSSSKWFSWELVCYSLLPFPHNIYFIPSQTQKNCRKWHILGNVLKVATYIHWRPVVLFSTTRLFCDSKRGSLTENTFKMVHCLPLFHYFRLSNTIGNKYKLRWLVLNCRSLVSETTTVPQPLRKYWPWVAFKCIKDHIS